MKKKECESLSHIKHNEPKWITDANVGAKTVKLLEGNIDFR